MTPLQLPGAATVPELLRNGAGRYPDQLALSARSVSGARLRRSYAGLVRDMDHAAVELASLGLAAGDRAATFLTNDAGYEFVMTALGAVARGAIVVPFNTRASDEEIRHAFALTEPGLVVVEASHAERLRGLAPAGTRLAVAGEDVFASGPGEEAPSNPGRGPGTAAPRAGDIAALLFTSGTTARSKAVMASHAGMIASGACCAAALGLRPGDVYQAGFPVFTSAALNIACMACWVAGAGFCLESVLNDEGRLAAIAAEGTSIYHGVPSVLGFMLDSFDPARHDLSGLRRIASGGAALPPDLAARLAETWPHADLVQIYGLTESGPTGTVLAPEEAQAGRGSIGRAMPGCVVEILGDDGQAVETGQTGEIAITGPAVAVGYFRDPEATRKAFSGRRVLTGDLGRLDAEGFLHFADRKKDVINRGGLKIASIAVEDVLHAHPAVSEAAVVAVPHAKLGEDVGAAVVLRPGQRADEAELRSHCAAALADYAVPRRWLVLDSLPRNPMGKVLKNELRARFSAPPKPGR
ncbi:class I adenylate-forming enzyme family protein [Bosea minatitlanensis]|uniref:Class I adenylate-forming enzyme family protein n=1 Tax=Bosea minatitlanensis TaxID=128782 RepID=A0ABW0F4V3_9HYPH|nr:class I adenylate-forming enzyme family protein [Bosea minatitlanensis]MCT4493392.1 acyl--CoA ligase [Bosea minatitlanensis]